MPLEGDEVVTDPERAAAACDENTIGVVSVLGSTFTGHYENVLALSAALDRAAGDDRASIFPSMSMAPAAALSRRSSSPNSSGISACRASSPSTPPATSTAWSIPAWAGSSGARPPISIQDLIFNVDYLGGTMPTLAINFSRPASQIVAQYYNLIRLGRSGYRAVHEACRRWPSNWPARLPSSGPSKCSRPGTDLPVFAWKLKEPSELVALRSVRPPARPRLAGAGLSHARQSRGTVVQRIVVRNGFTHDLAGMLLRDMKRPP